MKRLPLFAILLGAAGLLPFLLLALATLFWGSLGPVPKLGLALLTYGGAILSFLGAVHWGLAFEQPSIVVPGGTGRLDRQRLLLGVLPALWAWGAMYVGVAHSLHLGIALEIVGFLSTWACERYAARLGALPAGYLTLRTLLTTVVVLCLAAALLAPLTPYTI